MADDHTRQALADVEAQRDDAVVYLSAIRALLEVVARGHGVKLCAHEIAQVLVRELGVESCVVTLRDRDGNLALVGGASQAQRLGGPRGGPGESGWLSLARLVGPGAGAACFRREPDGAFTAVPAGESGEGCLVLPFSIGGEAGGALVLHWLLAPEPVFARGPALGLLAEIVGEAVTVAHVRDAMQRLCTNLEEELGVARRVLSRQQESLRAREDKIERLTEALIRSSRVKREFLGRVSHELRTPLNAILGYSSLLRDGVVGPVSDEQAAALDRVLGSTRNLSALIEDILFFIQVEADRVPVRVERVETRELVAEVLASLPERPEHIALRIEVAAEAARLRADASLVRRVLFHLLSNAFKFTARGEVSVTVQPGDEQGAAVLSVRDTGPGIPPDRVKELFTLYTQGDGSTTRRYSGLGMGLTLVQRCVRLLGGEVLVKSQPGAGCEFRVLLPGVLGAVEQETPGTPLRASY